jgi:hypothetical protein
MYELNNRPQKHELPDGPLFTFMVVGSVVAGFVLAFLALLESGGGHGSYVLAHLFFPWTILSTLMTGSLAMPALAVALIQYPAYVLAWPFLVQRFPYTSPLMTLLKLHAAGVFAALFASSTAFH